MFVLQGFELHYSRSSAIRTKTIIRDALTDVIEAGIRGDTEWNVQVIMATDKDQPLNRCRLSYRRKQKMDMLG